MWFISTINKRQDPPLSVLFFPSLTWVPPPSRFRRRLPFPDFLENPVDSELMASPPSFFCCSSSWRGHGVSWEDPCSTGFLSFVEFAKSSTSSRQLLPCSALTPQFDDMYYRRFLPPFFPKLFGCCPPPPLLLLSASTPRGANPPQGTGSPPDDSTFFCDPFPLSDRFVRRSCVVFFSTKSACLLSRFFFSPLGKLYLPFFLSRAAWPTALVTALVSRLNTAFSPVDLESLIFPF